MTAICREDHHAVVAKLFLVHPVRNAINHLVAFAVGGNLLFLGMIQLADQENIIVADEGHLLSVGREQWRLLWPVFREWNHPMVTYGIKVERSRKRVSVDTLRSRLNQDTLPVRTDSKAIDTAQCRLLHIIHVKQDTHLLTRLEGILLHPLLVLTDTSKVVTVRQRLECKHCRSIEVATCHILQLQFLTGRHPHCQQQTQPYHRYSSHHS